jgi:hypothetical protein
VIRRTEKGSDVNLASMLLVDGFRGDYEVAAVITTDADLALPLGMVGRARDHHQAEHVVNEFRRT